MSETKEEEVVTGDLLLTVDGKERHVPELKWRANREWQATMGATFAALVDTPADTADGIRAMGDAQRELILAYDRTGALGDLEDATERELDAIYNRLIEVSFPQASSRTALLMALARLAAESAPESSTSGPSPTGASVVPMTSRRRSRTARSSSSSTRRRSA